MPRLDTLLIVHGVHEKSRWRHVGCGRAYDALLEAADLERGARLPSEIRGETVLRALAKCGLSVDRRDVSRRLLASILVDVRVAAEAETRASVPPGGRTPGETPEFASARAGPNTLTPGASVSLGRFAALLALQCGGEVDEKLDVLFRAASRDSERFDEAVRGGVPRGALTEQQTVDALALHAAPVCKAAARSAGDTGEMGWIAQAWRDVARAHFARRASAGGFCDAARFRALATEAMHLVSERAEEEEEEGDARFAELIAFEDGDASGRSAGAADSAGAEGSFAAGAPSRGAPRGSGPPSGAAGLADVMASFAGGGSHGGSRDGGAASAYMRARGEPGHHRRDTSYESALGEFRDPLSSGPASFAGPSGSTHAHRRGKSEGAALTPARQGRKAEGGVLWQMFSNFSAGYTRGRSKTAGNESEMFDSTRGGGGAPGGASQTPFPKDGARDLDSPADRLSPIDSPRSPQSPASDDMRRVASFGALERVSRLTSPEKKQRARPRRHSGVSVDAGGAAGVGDAVGIQDADGDASGARNRSEDDEDEDQDEDELSDDDLSIRSVPKTKAERERLELRLALESARDETHKAEDEQTEHGAEFESAIAFAQEVGIRMFLYNIVKMLLVIALIAADASICVWTMFHFGIVIGLSVVMVINVGLALLFGFFVLRYTERERGMMHMEYGQHAFKNVTDMFDQNNVKSLGESLAMVTHTLQEGQGGEPNGGARGARNADERTNRVRGV
jgi:hypothetical protein